MKLKILAAAALSGCVLALVFTTSSAFATNCPLTQWLTEWKFTHWAFNYHSGFVKRGLIGELLRQANLTLTFNRFLAISLLLNLLVTGGLTYIFLRPFRNASRRPGSWFFFLFAATHPATIAHFNFDLGRFDGIMLLLVLLSMWIIAHGRTGMVWIWVFVFSSLAILVHEAAFIMYVPMLLTYAVYMGKGNDGSAKPCQQDHKVPGARKQPSGRLRVMSLPFHLLIFAALFMFTYLVATRGSRPAPLYDEHLAGLRESYGTVIQEASLQVLYRKRLAQNVQHAMSTGVTFGRLAHHALMGLVLAPSAVLILKIIVPRIVYMKSSIPLLLAAFSPLGLYLFGHDHFRWWALALTNLFIVISVLTLHDQTFSNHLCKVIHRERKLVYGVILLSLIAGPLGVFRSFPQSLIHHLFQMSAH